MSAYAQVSPGLARSQIAIAPGSWSKHSYPVIGTGVSQSLSIGSSTPGIGCGPFIDSVTLIPTSCTDSTNIQGCPGFSVGGSAGSTVVAGTGDLASPDPSSSIGLGVGLGFGVVTLLFLVVFGIS
jgi:hypothetical protein